MKSGYAIIGVARDGCCQRDRCYHGRRGHDSSRWRGLNVGKGDHDWHENGRSRSRRKRDKKYTWWSWISPLSLSQRGAFSC